MRQLREIVTLQLALQISLERVETIARQLEFSRFLCSVQMQQHVIDAVELVGADLAALALLIKPLQAPVSKLSIIAPEPPLHRGAMERGFGGGITAR